MSHFCVFIWPAVHLLKHPKHILTVIWTQTIKVSQWNMVYIFPTISTQLYCPLWKPPNNNSKPKISLIIFHSEYMHSRWSCFLIWTEPLSLCAKLVIYWTLVSVQCCSRIKWAISQCFGFVCLFQRVHGLVWFHYSFTCICNLSPADMAEAAFYMCAYEFAIKTVNSPWCRLFDEVDAKVPALSAI